MAKLIDWSSSSDGIRRAPLRRAPRPKWKLEEALEFLNGPDFIPAASDPARIEFDGPRHSPFPRRDLRVHGEQCRSRSSIPLRPALAGHDQSSFYSMASSRCYNNGLSFVCPPVQSVQGLMWPHLSPHTNLSAVRGEPLRELSGVRAGYVAERRRDSRAHWLAP